MLVEHLAQPGQLVGVAEIGGLHDIVEIQAEGPVGFGVERVAARIEVRRMAGTAGLVVAGPGHHLAVGVGLLIVGALGIAGLAELALEGGGGIGGVLLAALAARLGSVVVLALALVFVLVLAARFVIGSEVEVEVDEHVAHRVGEVLLVRDPSAQFR